MNGRKAHSRRFGHAYSIEVQRPLEAFDGATAVTKERSAHSD